MGVAKRNATPRAETEQHYSPSARISPPKNVATPTSSPNKMEVEDEMTLHSTPFAVRRKAALLMALALSVHLGGCESLCFDHVMIICYSINATCHGSYTYILGNFQTNLPVGVLLRFSPQMNLVSAVAVVVDCPRYR